MVRILANGEIVQDDDPRVRSRASINRNLVQRSSAAYNNNENYETNRHGMVQQEGPTVFDTWNQKLLQLGIPRWNIGSHVVEPLMSVLMLLTLLFFGIHGLLFLGLLYFVVKMSQRSTQQQSGNTEGRRSRFSQGFGGGHRLGS